MLCAYTMLLFAKYALNKQYTTETTRHDCRRCTIRTAKRGNTIQANNDLVYVALIWPFPSQRPDLRKMQRVRFLGSTGKGKEPWLRRVSRIPTNHQRKCSKSAPVPFPHCFVPCPVHPKHGNQNALVGGGGVGGGFARFGVLLLGGPSTATSRTGAGAAKGDAGADLQQPLADPGGGCGPAARRENQQGVWKKRREKREKRGLSAVAAKTKHHMSD